MYEYYSQCDDKIERLSALNSPNEDILRFLIHDKGSPPSNSFGYYCIDIPLKGNEIKKLNFEFIIKSVFDDMSEFKKEHSHFYNDYKVYRRKYILESIKSI